MPEGSDLTSARAGEATEGIILLAEDREDEVVLMRRAFAKANFLNPLYVVPNGEEAIAYLEGEGKYANRDEYPLPSLLLLDLKMPRKNGFEVLEWIRQQPSLNALRVVVLTASDEVRDVNRAYQMGANSFLVKPVDFAHFVEVTQALKGYWLWMSREPEISRTPRAPKRDPIESISKS
jgi:CheY-like chemotaxis protein